jgi:DNA-binding response OmpR family regulator
MHGAVAAGQSASAEHGAPVDTWATPGGGAPRKPQPEPMETAAQEAKIAARENRRRDGRSLVMRPDGEANRREDARQLVGPGTNVQMVSPPFGNAKGTHDSVSPMPVGSVLVIEDDGWVSGLLSAAIREAGYEVVVCSGAQEGLDRACADQPDCIVCDVDLPDHDGYWVARNVRTHASRVSVTPFLFLSGLDDEQSRLEGFHVGADVYMTKPFRVDEVVAQIGALVQMAARLRVRRDSMMSIPPSSTANAIEGDLGQMSIATVLTVLEMERRTGVFEVVSKKRRAQLEMARGGVIEGAIGGTKVSALTALRTMLTWTVGRFSFKPTAPREVPQSHKSLGAFLIEALRLEDEAARADLELPPSMRRSSEIHLAPAAIGGPPSSPADFAPPSSRTPDFVRGSAPGAAPSSGATRHAMLPLDPDLADWEIPESMTPANAPAAPLPKPPSLTIPRMAAIQPPTSPGARHASATPIPASPATPRLGPPRPAKKD